MQHLEIIGRWVMVIGFALVILGGLIWLLSRIPGLDHLPGTLKIEGSGFTCIVPVLFSILLSVVLTLILNLAARWIQK